MFNEPITPEKEKQFFLQMGLTTTETKVYLALIKIGPSSVGAISKETEIQRPNLYKILDSLITKCLIEKEISSPINYKASPPQETVNMLIEQKRAQFLEQREIGEMVAKSLEKQSKIYVLEESQNKNRFILIPGKVMTINRLRTALRNTQKSLDVVTSKKRFSPAFLTFADDYEEAAKRGVKIRIVTEDHIPEKEACLRIEKLSKKFCFEVRLLPPQVPTDTITSIFDETETFTTFSASADLTYSSSLWSNNPNFIMILQNYFEDKWKITRPIIP